MKTLTFHYKWQLAIVLLMSARVALAQDDIYYFPSKQKGENIQSTTVRGIDTSDITDYERYRALKEKENYNLSGDSNNNSENKQEPSVVVVKNDTTSGNVVVNNYYIDDDRFAYYRRFYLDYYYDPFWYDPFYWDLYYGWGGPFLGFYYSWGYPYYGYYGYWYRPWYSSYYNGYWNGFYSGFYWGYYADNLPTRGVVHYTPGRRMGGYVNISRTENTAYYSGRFASNDYYHGSRRNQGVTSYRTTANYAPSSVATNNNTSRRKSTLNNNITSTASKIDKSYSVINTTRPYIPARRTSNYVPTYNMNNRHAKYEPRRRTIDENNNYVVTNTRQIRNSSGNQNNITVVPTPRRSDENYTPPTRTTSGSTTQFNGYSNSNSGNYSSGSGSRSTANSAPSHNNSGSGRRR